MRPYGGIIGIDNYSVDKNLKISKGLRSHAILHDTTLVVSFTKYITRDLLTFKCFSGRAATALMVICREIVLLIYKGFSFVNFSFIGMLSSKTFVLDVEGFRHCKEKFNVKELGVCVSFVPPTCYSEFTTQQRQSFSWLTRNLHGIEWDTGNYLYIYHTQIIQSVRLRNPGAIFYAKGKEKVTNLTKFFVRFV